MFEAINKTKNTETGNGMWGMKYTWGMFIRIPGNVLTLVFRGMLEKIPENVPKDFGECFQFYYVLLKKANAN